MIIQILFDIENNLAAKGTVLENIWNLECSFSQSITLHCFHFSSTVLEYRKLVILPSKAKPAAKYKPGWVSWYSVYHHIGTHSDFLFFPNQPYQFIIRLCAECVCVVSSGNSSISKIGSLEPMIT